MTRAAFLLLLLLPAACAIPGRWDGAGMSDREGAAIATLLKERGGR